MSGGPVASGETPFGVGHLGDDLGDGLLSLDFGIWEFTWRSLVFFLGAIFVIPLPWPARDDLITGAREANPPGRRKRRAYRPA